MHPVKYDRELVEQLRAFVRQCAPEITAREFMTTEEKVGYLLCLTNLPWATNPVDGFWPDSDKVEILRHLSS